MSILSSVLRKRVLTTHKITSKEYFKEVGVISMGNNFKAQFLGLEIPQLQNSELAIWKLEKNSLDNPILEELGDKAEISISQFHAFLAANRESSEWFISYLKGKNGKLWAVSAYWNTDFGGWGVDAYSVSSPVGWGAGLQVVSQV